MSDTLANGPRGGMTPVPRPRPRAFDREGEATPLKARSPSAGAAGNRATLRTPDEAQALVPAWQALAGEASDDNPFLRPGFLLPAAAHLARHEVAIATAETGGGDLIALAPVVRTRLGGIARAWQVWTHPYAPLGTPLLRRGRENEALEALLDLIGRDRAVVIPDLSLDGVVAETLVTVAAAGGRSVSHLDRHQRATATRGSGDVHTALSRRHRKDYARLERRLAEQGAFERVAAARPAEVQAGFPRFLSLEASGWKGRRGTALASTTAVMQFAREAVFMRNDGRVRIDSVTLDGRPVAMVVSLVERSTLFTWKIAYDERLAAYSPGAQLMLGLPATVFGATEVRSIDSCAAPDHPMIDRLWPERRPMATVVIGPRPSPGVVLGLGLASARAEQTARRVLGRMWRRGGRR